MVRFAAVLLRVPRYLRLAYHLTRDDRLSPAQRALAAAGAAYTISPLDPLPGFIPIIGDLFEIVLLFLRYHFVFLDASSGEVVGKYQKTTLFRDHYSLQMTDVAFAKCDWRVRAAMGVGLDALQSR